MAGFQKSTKPIDCPHCGAKLLLTIEWIGYGPANEWEHEDCPKCGKEVASEKCGSIKAELAKD
ncbi:MAG: hypothetical protein IPK32_14825 [Verrucomicrobiaceae bacterium]|nr:hypothetical protein [Verrucomicrobiaceae bacterium]